MIGNVREIYGHKIEISWVMNNGIYHPPVSAQRWHPTRLSRISRCHCALPRAFSMARCVPEMGTWLTRLVSKSHKILRPKSDIKP